MTKSGKRKHWVGFDLGGTKMLSLVVNRDFETVGRARAKTLGFEGARAVVDRIITTIGKSLAEAKLDASDLSGIGIGCPGPLDLDRGVVIEAPNLGWAKVPIKDVLEKEFACPAVIMNDVDGGVYGEYRFGAGRGGRCVLGVFPGTGIGGGCVYEDKILRGKTGSCMEIGHIQVLPDGPLCGCGRRGCLEAVASRLAIAADAAKAAYRGEAPALHEAAGTDVGNIRSGALSRSIKSGDKVVRRIVTDAAQRIGVAVGSVISLLSPDIVVLGGGLVEEMPDLFVSTVSRAAREHTMPAFADTFTVVAAKLGDDATAKGAAAWSRYCVEKK
jgi:glucokinase